MDLWWAIRIALGIILMAIVGALGLASSLVGIDSGSFLPLELVHYLVAPGRSLF